MKSFHTLRDAFLHYYDYFKTCLHQFAALHHLPFLSVHLYQQICIFTLCSQEKNVSHITSVLVVYLCVLADDN